jgi:hypothetical protein
VDFKTTNYKNASSFKKTFPKKPDANSSKYYLVITKGNGSFYVQTEGSLKQ